MRDVEYEQDKKVTVRDAVCELDKVIAQRHYDGAQCSCRRYGSEWSTSGRTSAVAGANDATSRPAAGGAAADDHAEREHDFATQ